MDSLSPTGHIAVVVLVAKADEASVRTLQQCSAIFEEDQVHAIGFAMSPSVEQMLSNLLDEHDRHLVHLHVYATPDKRHALADCCSKLPRKFTHVLLVDANVGARTALLQDSLRRSIAIPTCAYFFAGRSTRRRRRTRRRPSGKSRRFLVHHPTFHEESDDTKPNHFLDLWERRHLLVYLETNKHQTLPKGYFCSLEQAILQSTKRAKRFSRDTFITATPCKVFENQESESETEDFSSNDTGEVLLAYPVIDAEVSLATPSPAATNTLETTFSPR